MERGWPTYDKNGTNERIKIVQRGGLRIVMHWSLTWISAEGDAAVGGKVIEGREKGGGVMWTVLKLDF